MAFLLRLMERGSVRKRAADLAELRSLIAPTSGVRLLDVGGGAGAATERFATGCSEVVVLEPDRGKVVQGRKHRPTIRFEEGRAERIPFPDAAFDRVTAVEGCVRKRDPLCAAFLKSNRWSVLSALDDFPSVRLQDNYFGATRRESFRRGARAASDIEEANPGCGSDQGAQLGEVGRALPDTPPFHQPEQERHETLSSTLRLGKSSRNFAAEDLAEHFRVDVPPGDTEDRKSTRLNSS